MIKIELKRSGGMLGKTLQAESHVDMDEQLVVQTLKNIPASDNPDARDDFYHSITINENQTFPVDINLLKGKLKKVVTALQSNLKVKKK